MNYGEATPPAFEKLTTQVIDAAFHVHTALGPGLLESVYEACLLHDLTKRSLKVQRQLRVPIYYDGLQIDDGLRIDLLVEDQLIIELKAVEKHNPLFEAQVITYLKLTNRQVGLLINFNVPLFKDGIKRIFRKRKSQL